MWSGIPPSGKQALYPFVDNPLHVVKHSTFTGKGLTRRVSNLMGSLCYYRLLLDLVSGNLLGYNDGSES